jgi:putative tryptophan/tyrosine transport system substrate-binding protein
VFLRVAPGPDSKPTDLPSQSAYAPATRRVSRRSFSMAVLACVAPAIVKGEQTPLRPMPRIGLLVGDDPEGGVAAFTQTLSELGYADGRNLAIEMRETGGTLPVADAARELARMDLALLVAHSLPGALAVREANPTMPMVIVTTPGFAINGFAKTLDRPGGNVTGIDELPPGVTAHRLELLKTAAPNVSRLALLSTTPGSGVHEIQLADAQEAAARLGIATRPYRATSVPALKEALAAIAADSMDGLLNFQGGLSYVNRQSIVDFAAKHRLPAIYQATVFAQAGGLMTWAPSLVDQFRTAAGYVAQILKGARPGDLPVRYPSRYYLTLNNTAARHLGLSFPPNLLSEADRVLP